MVYDPPRRPNQCGSDTGTSPTLYVFDQSFSITNKVPIAISVSVDLYAEGCAGGGALGWGQCSKFPILTCLIVLPLAMVYMQAVERCARTRAGVNADERATFARSAPHEAPSMWSEPVSTKTAASRTNCGPSNRPNPAVSE